MVWLAVLAYHLSQSVVAQAKLPAEKVRGSLTYLVMLYNRFLFRKLMPLVEVITKDTPAAYEHILLEDSLKPFPAGFVILQLGCAEPVPARQEPI